MILDDDLALLQQPVRLRIMTLLYQRNDVSASDARATLDLTAGNLESHARKLEAADWLRSRKALGREGFVQRLRITHVGVERFDRYLDALESFVTGVKGDRTPAGDDPTPA